MPLDRSKFSEDEFAEREMLVERIEGSTGVSSDAWYEFSTDDLRKLRRETETK